MAVPIDEEVSVGGPAPARAVHVGLVQAALSLGGFAIGTVEFASMSLLPQFSRDLQVEVPIGGQAITAYALGVVIGAPAFAVLGARIPRRAFLSGLMALYALGNLVSAWAPSFAWLLVARFVSGLPHGTYFGVAGLLAASLVPVNKRAQAVARVLLGLTIATIIGVPLANVIGRAVGWRWAFILVAVLAAATAVSVLLTAPRDPTPEGASWRRELGALRRRQVWLTLAVGAIGQGGLFSVYTYLASTLTLQAHASSELLPFAFGLFGVGMTISLMTAGYFADRSIMRTAAACLLWSMGAMSVYALSVDHVWSILPATFLVGCGCGLVAPIQTRLMDVAGDAQTMAAALNHSAFNVANAIGPAAGGLALAAGLGWSSTGWVGVGLAAMGLAVLAIANADARRAPAS
ncbi:MAG TPA: MFS transporter [Polyangiales bacterium]|nr:MFS transporter [Polyangiales bacterium]